MTQANTTMNLFTRILSWAVAAVLLMTPFAADSPEKTAFTQNLDRQMQAIGASGRTEVTLTREGETMTFGLSRSDGGFALDMTAGGETVRVESSDSQVWVRAGGSTFTLRYENVPQILALLMPGWAALNDGEAQTIGRWLTDLWIRCGARCVTVEQDGRDTVIRVRADVDELMPYFVAWVDGVVADPAFDGMISRWTQGAATGEQVRAEWKNSRDAVLNSRAQTTLCADIRLSSGTKTAVNASVELVSGGRTELSGLVSYEQSYGTAILTAQLVAGGTPVQLTMYTGDGCMDAELRAGETSAVLRGTSEDGVVRVDGSVTSGVRGRAAIEFGLTVNAGSKPGLPAFSAVLRDPDERGVKAELTADAYGRGGLALRGSVEDPYNGRTSFFGAADSGVLRVTAASPYASFALALDENGFSFSDASGRAGRASAVSGSLDTAGKGASASLSVPGGRYRLAVDGDDAASSDWVLTAAEGRGGERAIASRKAGIVTAGPITAEVTYPSETRCSLVLTNAEASGKAYLNADVNADGTVSAELLDIHGQPVLTAVVRGGDALPTLAGEPATEITPELVQMLITAAASGR